MSGRGERGLLSLGRHYSVPRLSPRSGEDRLNSLNWHGGCGTRDLSVALWCNWLTRCPLKAESTGSIPVSATIFLTSRHSLLDHPAWAKKPGNLALNRQQCKIPFTTWIHSKQYQKKPRTGEPFESRAAFMFFPCVLLRVQSAGDVCRVMGIVLFPSLTSGPE